MKTVLGRLTFAIPFLAFWSAAVVSGQSDNWPQWRGPDVTAVVPDDPQLPETWSATDNVAWRTTIPGLGWSSPIVWGDKVFVTSVVADEAYEGPSAGLCWWRNLSSARRTRRGCCPCSGAARASRY